MTLPLILAGLIASKSTLAAITISAIKQADSKPVRLRRCYQIRG